MTSPTGFWSLCSVGTIAPSGAQGPPGEPSGCSFSELSKLQVHTCLEVQGGAGWPLLLPLRGFAHSI